MLAPRPRAIGGFLADDVVVIGRLPELVPERLPDVGVERVALGDLDELTACPSALVIDLRDLSTDALVVWMRSRSRSHCPLLLVTQTALDDDIVELVGADDVVRLPDDGVAGLIRRIRLAMELGHARLSLSFASQALAESVNGLSVVDVSRPESPLVEVSPVFERMTQYDRDEVLGTNCRLLQRGDNDQPGIEELRRAVRARSRGSAVVRNYRKDGTRFWNEVTIFPIEIGGRPTRWMGGVQHDVTQVVEAQAEIETLYRMMLDQQAFDHGILDGVEVGIITTDAYGVITFANRAATDLLRDDDDLTGGLVTEVLRLEAPPTELMGDEPRRVLEVAFETADGTRLELEIALSRGKSVDDARVGFFFIFRDVREERAREAERHRFEHLAAMGTMVAGFAHEVRNPVAALRSIAEELAEELTSRGGPLPHPGRMLRVLERIERLVRTSLQFGRPAAPRRAAHRPWTICSAALAGVGPRTMGSGEEIRVEMDPDLPDVFVDEGQLTQALVVLLDNALDAVGRPGRVLLKVGRARPREGDPRARKTMPPPAAALIRFEVTDEGPGIPPEDVTRIFDPFFTTKPSGTGLGLSIAQQVVSENGGRLEVVTARGGPTTFAAIVPANEEAD